jgi:threonyl-tRNA synthetase
VKICIREGEVLEHAGPATLKEVFVEHDKSLLKEFIAARTADEERVDFHTELADDAQVELIAWNSDEAAWIYRHSMSHVMAQAVRRLFPEVKLAIGPAIEDGFYYDFDAPEPFTNEDLKKIEKEMKRVGKENHRFEREDVSRDQARELLADESYKL